MGWRTTAQNLNLNRDYMKAQTPEMRAMLQLIQKAQPALYLDVHVTDGIDYQYDITFGFNGWDGSFAWSPQIGAWLDRTLRPALDAGLKAAGHIPGPLVFAANDRDLGQGIAASPYNPRYLHGLWRSDSRAFRARRKPFPEALPPARAWHLCAPGVSPPRGRRRTRPRCGQPSPPTARPGPESLAFNWSGKPDKQTTMDFLGIAYEEYASPASGAKEVRWLGTPKTYRNLPVHHVTRPGVTLRRPKAYYVPVTETGHDRGAQCAWRDRWSPSPLREP